MRWISNPCTDAHRNMALDAWCMDNIRENIFWLWQNSPSVIVGRNQNVRKEVNLQFLEQKGIALARRVTGGGAVYHDWGNLNYSFVGREPSPQPIVDALRQMGIPAELTGRNDIFVEGKKVSGYARSFGAHAQLVHGTLMFEVDLDTLTRALDVPGSKLNLKGVDSVKSRVGNLKEYLPAGTTLEDFRSRLHAILADGDAEFPLPAYANAETDSLADRKFRRREWIMEGV